MSAPQLHYYDVGADVTAFSTTRHGGVSRGNYGSFNINAYCGDEVGDVEENRRRLCAALGLSDTSRLVVPHQVHGTVVRRITPDFLKNAPDARQQLLEGVDAVMTDVPDVCIGVSTADCIPIIICDPRHRAACVVHAGWRGTLARIVRKAVCEMQQVYGSRPQQLKAVIGPGISLKNFEVGDEVWQLFADAGFPMKQLSSRYPSASSAAADGQKWHIDLWACNRQQLVEAGLSKASITVAGICTYDRVDDYFSARRLGIASGRVFSGVVIKKSAVF